MISGDDWEINMLNNYIEHIRSLGFRAYASDQSKMYRTMSGYITDKIGSRVLSFEIGKGAPSRLSGNYGPRNLQCGDGWVLQEWPEDLKTREDVERALYSHPPSWCIGWKYLLTESQYLERYSKDNK